jgi:hypothetical protein
MRSHAVTAFFAVGMVLGALTVSTRLQQSQAQEKVATGKPIAQDAPPLLKQINNGNWLDDAEARSLVDELYYQRAVHAYMTMLPALNTIGMRDGSEKEFGAGYNA